MRRILNLIYITTILMGIVLCLIVGAYAQTCPNPLAPELEIFLAEGTGTVIAHPKGDIVTQTGEYYSTTFSNCVFHGVVEKLPATNATATGVDTSAGYFAEGPTGQFTLEVISQEEFDAGLRPVGYGYLTPQQKLDYQNLLGEDNVPPGTKYYSVPDGGRCKQKSAGASHTVPGDDTFVWDRRVYDPGLGLGRGSVIRTYTAPKARWDRVEGFGDGCCKVFLMGSFNVPTADIPLTGFSTITTTVSNCDGTGSVDMPVHIVDWSQQWPGGRDSATTTTYKPFMGTFVLEVPCGECKRVEFKLSTNSGTYTLEYHMDCDTVACKHYDWGF